MQRDSIWNSPPPYKGPSSNKKVIKDLANMSNGLAAMATAKQPSVARRLISLGDTLMIYAASAGRKAFILANVIAIYDALINLRSSLSDGGNAYETDGYLSDLESHVKVLGVFLERGVSNSPLDARLNRSVIKFIEKKAAVESIARATEHSLANAERKLCQLRKACGNTPREKRSIAQAIMRVSSFINARRAAVDTLSSIVDSLKELEDTARLSAGLSKRINRIIRLKPLADFYDRPVHSQRECDKLYQHLYYLIQNQIKTCGHTAEWNGVIDQFAKSSIHINEDSSVENFEQDVEATENIRQTKVQKQKNLWR